MVDQDQAALGVQEILVEVCRVQKLWDLDVRIQLGFCSHTVKGGHAEVDVACFKLVAGAVRVLKLLEEVVDPVFELELAAVLVGLTHHRFLLFARLAETRI